MHNRSHRSVPLTPAIVRAIQSRLHQTPCGVCACGPCAHQVALAAQHFGQEPAAVREALLSAAKPTPPGPPPRPRRPLTAQIGATATMVVDGKQVSIAEGLAAVIAAAGDPPR